MEYYNLLAGLFLRNTTLCGKMLHFVVKHSVLWYNITFCSTFVVYLWYICGIFVVYLWYICDIFVVFFAMGGMTECLECSLTRLVLPQSWSQTVLTEPSWYSTTKLPSGRDPPLSQCVLRRRDSESETRGQERGANPPPSSSLPVARAGNTELDRYP